MIAIRSGLWIAFVLFGLAIGFSSTTAGLVSSARADEVSDALEALLSAAGSNSESPPMESPGEAPMDVQPDATGMAQDQIAWCDQQAQAMQVDSQSWGGTVQDISSQLGQMQRQLFEGPCAGHPNAAAYIAGADRMLQDGQQVVAQPPETQQQPSWNAATSIMDDPGLGEQSAGTGFGAGCEGEAQAIAERANARTAQLTSVTHQTETLMAAMDDMIAACPGSPERAQWERTRADAARTCGQIATRTCQSQWH
jgi:hypothetical protein